MVVTLFPSTAETGVTHERVATPFTCTVHAPHWAMPQPNLVPGRSNQSRNAQRSGVSCDPLNSTLSSLMMNLATVGSRRSGRGGYYILRTHAPEMKQTVKKMFATADEAEVAFYDAFERANLSAMMAVWA